MLDVPDSIDGMSQKEAVEWTIGKVLPTVQNEVGRVNSTLRAQLDTQAKILKVMLDGHPRKGLIMQALEAMGTSPGLGFDQAFRMAEGEIALRQNRQLSKQVNRNQQLTQRRAGKAAQASRPPTPAPKAVPSTKAQTTADVARQVARELGY
jgi:hypothetical protein